MKVCKFEGCDQKAVNRGYCNKHYQVQYKKGLIKPKRKRKRKCKAPDCSEKKLEANGYCTRHYKQMRRYGKIFKTKYDPNDFVYYENKIGIILRDWYGNFKAEAIVDAEDDWVKEYKWHLVGKKSYVATYKNGKHMYLHRFFFPDAVQVDHIDRNPLNNCKSNLRSCNNAQNSWNTGLMSHNTSGVAGVHFCNIQKRWISRIRVNNESKFLGQFIDFDEAVRVRKMAEKKYFGEYSPKHNNIKEAEYGTN